jgi:hypothetical protein
VSAGTLGVKNREPRFAARVEAARRDPACAEASHARQATWKYHNLAAEAPKI